MGSKAVLQRAKSGRAVIQAIETHAAEVREAAMTLLGPYAKKNHDAPDVGPLLFVSGAMLTARIAAMEAADDAHETELADDKAPRDSRDASRTALRSAAVVARGIVEAAYGSRGLAAFAMTTAVPEDATALIKYSKGAVKALGDAKVKAPRLLGEGVTISRSAIEANLAALVPPLEKALADVRREAREAESTQKNKDRAIEAYDRVFGQVAGLATAIFELAGESELADRVRPSARKPGRTEVEVADDEAPDQTPE